MHVLNDPQLRSSAAERVEAVNPGTEQDIPVGNLVAFRGWVPGVGGDQQQGLSHHGAALPGQPPVAEEGDKPVVTLVTRFRLVASLRQGVGH